MTTRTLPAAIEAEQQVLGGILANPSAFSRVADLIGPDDFYRSSHRALYCAITEVAALGIEADAVTVHEQLQGAQPELARLAMELAANGIGANLRDYAQLIRDRSMKRRMIDAATDILAAAYAPDAPAAEQVSDDAIRALMSTTRTTSRHEVTLREALKRVHEQLADAVHNGPRLGIATGVAALDALTGGFHNGELTLFGARAKMGKTAMLMTAIDAAIAAGIPLGVIAAEESAEQGARRLISGRSAISAATLRNGDLRDEQWPRLTDAITSMYGAKAWLFDEPAPSIERVVQVARRWRHEHGIRILFVDYVQRLTLSRARAAQSRFERIGEVAKGLSTLARDLDIPIVAGAQVKREVDTRPKNKRPGMGDLSDSSELEKEAACVVMVYRDEVYHPDSPDKGTAELIVEANRWGPPGFVRAAWLADRMRFADLEREP